MSNAIKLINYLQPQGEFLTFFSELNSDLTVGDKVYVIGGNYDNTKFTDKTHAEFNPFDEFATGYTVLAVDNTDNSNAITLNIQYRLAKFNLSGLDTSVFNPKPVYKTEDELLIDPNQIREAYMSKSYFKRGEFNGGTFDDGIIGEYNIKGKSSNKIYERQKFVDNLSEAENLNLNSKFDYSSLTEPALNNKVKFNNKFTSDAPATFKNGVFLGGEYQWGQWNNKFDSSKVGKIQTLNEFNQPFNSLDESKFNIQKFADDNSGFGYSMVVSGNVGKVYEGEHNIEFINGSNGTSFMIFNDYIPYQLWKSTESNFKFNLQIRVHSPNNNKTFDIKFLDKANKKIIFEENKTFLTLDTTDTDVVSQTNDVSKKYYKVEQLIFNETGSFNIEIYIKDNESGIRNVINKSIMLNPDIFGGVIDNTWMQGGDVWGGEFRKGRVSSKYSQFNWWDGIFNGKKEESFAENIRWEEGTWIDGNWKGDITIPIKNYVINSINNTTDTNIFYIDIPAIYKHLFKIGDNVFISYIKKSIGSRYFQNFTDQPTEYPLNFREFELIDVLQSTDLDNLLQVRLELRGAVDVFKEDVSLQYAKVSQSHFNKGVWNDGIWESGLRKVYNKEIIDVRYADSTAGLINHEITLQLNTVENLYLGQRVEATNLEIVREIEVGIIDGVSSGSNFTVDDRGTNGAMKLTFIEPLNQTLTILNIDNSTNKIIVKFPKFEKIDIDNGLNIKDDYKIITIRKKLNYNEKSELGEAIWVNGEFHSGAWNGGIFRGGLFNSKLYFDINNTEIQSIFQSGYWKNGQFTNSALLSGVWENGTINSGVVTNLFNNENTNSGTTWDNGDTVFIDGTINDVEWRRGLMLKSMFNNGKIINGGIENVKFNAGQFTNGLGVYKNDVVSNRSGRQTDDKRFVDLSAPSVIYIDGEGWVQLDQPSYFQKDYNVIFKDLDRFPNPLDGQMFDVLNRDKYASKIKINYSTSGDNPLYLTEDFSLLKPILAVDNMIDFAQIDENIYWVADSGNNRILVINNLTKKVDVLGKILLQEDKWNFTGLKFIASAIKFTSLNNLNFVYVIDTKNGVDTLRRISLDENNNPDVIIDYTMPLNTGETIIDLKVVVEGTVQETVICLTSQNRLLYTSTKTNELKAVVLDTFVTGSSNITALRKTNTNSIDLLVLNNNTISHLVLDYNTSNDIYVVRVTSPIIINGLDFIVNNIRTFSAKYEGNGLDMFIVIEDAEKNDEIYKFTYNEFFNGDVNTFLLLNDIAIDFPIYRTKMSQYFGNLNSILLHRGNPLILSSSDLFKNTTGFGNPLSQIRLMEVNSLQSSSGYAYWIYDDATDRLIFVDENNPNQYDPNNDVDTLRDASNRYEIVKMTQGESKTIVYSIQRSGSTFSVRKTERGKIDNTNSTIYTINNVSYIYDIVYSDKLFVLLKTINGEYKIVELNQTQSNVNVDALNYYSSNLNNVLSPNTNYNNISMDIIKVGASYIGAISASDSATDVIELRLSNTTVNAYRVYTRVPYIVNDTLIKYEETIDFNTPFLSYSIFFATSNGIIKVVSDKLINTIPNKLRWSQFGVNLYYPTNNVKEIYLDSSNSKIVSSFGAEFSVIDSKYFYNTSASYVEENNELESFNVVIDPTEGDIIVGLSHSRLIEAHSTSSLVLEANVSVGESFEIGRFDQNSTAGLASNRDFLLNSPKSIVKSTNNTFFFIDNVVDGSGLSQIIRTYKYGSLVTPNYDIVLSGVNQVVNKITDLSYLGNSGSNFVYYNTQNVNNSTIRYFNVASPTIHTMATTTNTNDLIKKFSVNIISGKLIYVILTTNNVIKYKINSGSWSNVTNLPYSQIDDISIVNDGSQTLLYILENNKLHYIDYNGTFNGLNTEDIPSNNIISNISENDTNTKLAYFDKTANLVAKIGIDTSLRNETFVKIKDFAYNPTVSTPNYVFLYNEPVSNAKGVIRQPYNSQSVRLSLQINNISTGTFKKIVSIDDNTAYVLFDEGVSGLKIYKYDFSNNTVIAISNPNPLYRNGVSNPSNITNYKLYPVDITHYNSKLIAIFEYYDTGSATNFYDVFGLNNNTFDKTDVSWLYARDSFNNPLPIDNVGSSSGLVYPTSVPSGTGNLQMLFKSPIAPHIYSGRVDSEDYVSLYFGNNSTSGNFLKLVKNNTVTPLISNQYDNLVLKINIPSFNRLAETVTKVELSPNPITNTGTLNASSTGTVSITIGTDTISLANNEIWAIFPNNTQYTTTNNTFNVKVTTKLIGSNITATSYTTGINDYRMYVNSGDKIIIKTSNPIDTINSANSAFEMIHSTTGIWSIYRYDLNHNLLSATPEKTLLAPVTPTSKNINLLAIASNINIVPLFLDGLDLLDNTYKFSDITKGYKVSDDNSNINQTLSPYLTSRVLYKTILNEGVQFNNLGTPKTAHFVASRWNNNLFLGTWDEPNYFNNKIIEDFSVFVNGIFEGDFYDGFFLGGEFRNNTSYSSNLIQGHFISDNKDINISSGNVDAKYRYDILKMNWKNQLLNFTLEGLYLDGDDYKNYPISKIGKGSWIKIPNLFNKLEFTIEEIWNSKIKVDGKNEITFVIKNPTFLDSTLSTYIIKFFQERELFVESYEYAEELFGVFKVLNVFKKDDSIYITINSDFNKFNQQGKYQPVIKPKIIFNQYLKVLSSKTYIRSGKAYSDFTVDMFSPLNTDDANYGFIEKIYFKDSIEVIKSGTYKGHIQIPNYLQVFNTSLTKTDKKFKAKFNSALENLLITDIVSTAIGDDSKIQVEIPTNETVIGHDIIVENSQIETSTLRKDVFVENSIFLSGKLYSNVRTSAWLSVDDKGFSHGQSQIGDADNSFEFEGNNVKIIDFYFEGNDFIWIQLENIIFNVDKYRWITLRGFTGNKSQLIGATRSRVFRIEEVQDNLIKIRNPFLYYDEYNIENGTNFNKDRIQIAKQSMLLKGLEGDNIKCSNSDAHQFGNNTFANSLAFGETTDNWYYKTTDVNTSLFTTSADGTNGLKAKFTTANEVYKKVYQKYEFKSFVNYTFDLNYLAQNSVNTSVQFQVYFDGVPVITNNGLINTVGTTQNKFTFTYSQFEDKEVEVAIEIKGSNSSNNPCYGVVKSLVITNKPQDETYDFYYGWASPSAFNGGDFYGDFNSIWNAGNFRKGNFNGKWFGSEENHEWNGKVWVETIPSNNRYEVRVYLDLSTRIIDNVPQLLGGASVDVGDYVYVNFNSVFNNGVIEETFGGHYGIVENSTAGLKYFRFQTDDNIPTDKYAVNITTYRKSYNNANYMVTDYNYNVKINDNPLSYKFMDWDLDSTLTQGTNGVLIFDGINHINTIDYIDIANKNNGTGFSIDLLFKYDTSNTIQPLLAFQNTSAGLSGIKLYIKDNSIYLKYKDESTNEREFKLNSANLSSNSWNHILITFGVNITSEISTLISGSYVLQNITTFDNTMTILPYDISFIGKMLNLEADKSISTYTYKGKLDEVRIWNLDLTTLNTQFDSQRMRNFIFDSTTNKLNKFVNKYIPELSAYWNADKLTTLDTGSYYPEEETYFVLKGDNGIVLQDDLSGTNFSYKGNNLFVELDFFPEQYKDASDTRGEYKLLTLQESRELPNNNFTKYYLELIIKEVSKTSFYFIIREKVTVNSTVLFYPLINSNVDYSKDIIFSDIINYKEFYNWYNLILTDTELYINGNKIGDYTLSNRNLLKYTVDTNIILGQYEFAKIGNNFTPKTKGLRGFVRNLNLWENKKFKDEYAIYRILSGENTDLYNNPNNILNSNLLLKSGSTGQNVVPYFNADGSNIWESYLYASENGYTQPLSNIDDLNINYLNTALPQSNWLDGSDFNIITTNQNVIKPNTQLNILNNSNYLLTKAQGTNSVITISNMDNFKFFGKKIADNNGNAKLNVTDNGYLFFENLLTGTLYNQNYPLFKYTDNETSKEYKQVSTTDAIMFSNTLDIRSYKDGFVKWVDRDDEFIIEFYGKSTKFNQYTITPTNVKNYYDETTTNSEITTSLFSFYAIRIDKVNSNIMTYIRRMDESPDQKLLGLRRSDGYWSYINDTSGLVNFYKQPNGQDFVIGYSSTKGNVVSSNDTEYVVFVPRFNVVDETQNFVNYLADKDYDYLDTNYGLKIFKQFKGTLLNQYKIKIDGTALTGINKKYMVLFPTYKDLVLANYTNPNYDLNEQYTINSSLFTFNGLNDEAETLVSRASFFYDGNFNANVWHNGIFVDGLINVDNFVWKYGIKHNGRLEGGELLKNYAHWLGGYHLGQNDDSFVRNLVWLRGIFDGGTWERGHWLSLDLNNQYKVGNKINNDWSVWRSGEWYSRVNETIIPQIQNLFTDGNNGTFGGSLNNWNLQVSSNIVLSSSNIPSSTTTAAFVTSNVVSNSYGQFGSSFRGNSQILVNRNTEYTITAKVNIPSTKVGGVKIIATGDRNINNILNIAYRRETSLINKYDVQEGSNNKYDLIAESGNTFVANIKHTFNTGDNDFIYIQVGSYQHGTLPFTYYISNIEIIGENIKSKDFNPYDIKNHDSVWHGGTWESEVKETGDEDEFGNPIFFKHTWESDDTKLYHVKNNQILTLPTVNSIWLGGLWLRGEFRGGIFANGFWHSVDCKAATSGFAYEKSIGQTYNSTSSVFYNGKMINTIWYGGTVLNQGDKLDVVFGDLINLDSNLTNSKDFTWKHDEFKFKKSDFSKAYSNDILGREIFTGYHYDPVNDGSANRIEEIEKTRVRRQVNSDGIMPVYWKRGSFDNGMFQFSHWDSLNLNNDRQLIISEDENKNSSIFRRGLIHSSLWKSGLFYANSSRDRYPFNDTDEPNSLFYYSHWERGYWKAKGLKKMNEVLISSPYYSSLDTTDNIEISNALFSRSLWDAGVFEGGTMDLSIWRSGVTDNNIQLEYKKGIVNLVPSSATNNLAFLVSDKAGTNTDFVFSTSGVNGFNFVENGTSFIKNIKNSNYRWVGSVDNMSSIFVNGHMKGSIWHGGIWQRGMFEHKNLVDIDFFDRDITSNVTLDNYQLGIWNRGLWLSGYFSNYDDRIIDKKSINPQINNSYLFNNATTTEAGRRSLFMSIDAENVTDNGNIIGINTTNFNNLLNVIKYNVNNKNNYASFFMRRLLKERTDRNAINTYPNKKAYFSVMNGSVLNGVLYQDMIFTGNTDHEDRYVLSLFATVSESYNKTAYNNQFRVSQNNIAGDKNAFVYEISYSKSSIDKFVIPYTMSPLTWDTSQWSVINNNGTFNQSFLTNYNNGFATPTTPFPHIWRHNYDERTSIGSLFGDGTIVNGTSGLRPMYYNSNNNQVQISIAQGDGMSWISDEPQGEPKYNGNEMELNYTIISFHSNNISPLGLGFADYGTNGFETDI